MPSRQEGEAVVFGFELHDGVEQLHVGGLDFELVVLHVGVGIGIGVVAVHFEADSFHGCSFGLVRQYSQVASMQHGRAT